MHIHIAPQDNLTLPDLVATFDTVGHELQSGDTISMPQGSFMVLHASDETYTFRVSRPGQQYAEVAIQRPLVRTMVLAQTPTWVSPNTQQVRHAQVFTQHGFRVNLIAEEIPELRGYAHGEVPAEEAQHALKGSYVPGHMVRWSELTRVELERIARLRRGTRQDTLTPCAHCGRGLTQEDGRWVDPEATGDDSVWRETCDQHDTFTAEHEPSQEGGQ